MKTKNEDILTILVVAGIIMVIIGSSYIIRDVKSTGSPGAQSEDVQESSSFEESPRDDKKENYSTCVRPVIDGIMAVGLLIGLSLILQDKVNYGIRILIVGVIVVLVDIYLRKLF